MSGTVDVLGYAPSRVFSISFFREAIFRSIMQLLDSGDIPQVFIATSYAQATAIHEVAYFRNLEQAHRPIPIPLGVGEHR